MMLQRFLLPLLVSVSCILAATSQQEEPHRRRRVFALRRVENEAAAVQYEVSFAIERS
jgi:hypothetical protein